MSAQKYVVMMVVLGLATVGLTLQGASRAHAQGLGEMSAVTQGMDTLNSGGTGSASSGVGNIGLNRAQTAAATANSYGATQMGGMNATAPGGPMPGQPMPGQPMPGQPMPEGMPQMGGIAGVGGTPADQLSQMNQLANSPKITVISGMRIFDAISGELVDDVAKKKVPESEKDKYFDDGTHGDLTPNDEVYTRVDGEVRDVIGVANQKVKEQLVQALRVAADYNPVEFYGYSLMSTDRQQPIPRNEAWTIVKDPSGGPGMMLAERPVEKPIEVPKFREKLKEKDQKVKDDWSFRFLQEYRKKKDDLSSEFFSVYIPQPPMPPTAVPPTGWMPFADPAASQKAAAASNPYNPMFQQYGMQQQQQDGGMMGGQGGSMGSGRR